MNIFQIIEQYSKVVIFRHIRPDFDAFGSQFGLAKVIKEEFPNIQVMIGGTPDEQMLSQMKAETFDTFENTSDALAIVCDTSNRERIDGDISDFKYVIKIDHHIVVDSYGDLNIEYPAKSSACQIVAELCEKYLDHPISKQAATYLYFGMITDSNRFLYDSTDDSTFNAASYLVKCKVVLNEVYSALYMKDEKELEIKKYIYQLYQKSGNILYYVLTQKDLDALNISRSKGSDYVNLLADVKGYPIWVAVSENIEENNYRVSIRSRKIAINDIANQYRGGGHAQASGCTLLTLDELPSLLAALQARYDEDPVL